MTDKPESFRSWFWQQIILWLVFWPPAYLLILALLYFTGTMPFTLGWWTFLAILAYGWIFGEILIVVTIAYSLDDKSRHD